MARYRGPKHRLARREGKNILEKTSESLTRRLNIPPGMHAVRSRRRVSEYGIQLREKQVAKRTYNLLEKQFRKYYDVAKKVKGKTGEKLLQMLETRLDNVVYRLGFAPSRNMARQLVSHRHISINGKVVNIPSYKIKVNEVVSIGDKAMKIPSVAKLLENENFKVLDWLERKANSGKVNAIPTRDQIPTDVNEQLIVEFYSK
ncbi:30S ribosomal protein S4 [Candidatus Gottesmanbacteria bacterium RIFCSPHIGHO2_01_FULL_42_12]|uniref:Small ribosomal subunit protein uS4 n=1 Tax=Candidatus Gottesmanbacteria bacterium RIFCSPHIGHO2_01_FULL_42_12 TaxID=1798377 RepID=A0A1F5Z065_9BACT|nr:MAG: 30S ribosomal protein S4 [Candidatus Gottesmanbacteria bacterium RIFCSPHIGHO2_01_FULL_42_12]